MITTPFTVDFNSAAPIPGDLIITDPNVLIRPAVPGQYPPSVKHDSGHAYRILDLGNDMGAYITHIIWTGDHRIAHQMLDRVFYAFVDACCLELWCDAVVIYKENGDTVYRKEYGFEDGQYTMTFYVHCNVATDDVDQLVTETISNIGDFIVVRPDSSGHGFTAQGYHVDEPLELVEDDEVGPHLPDDDTPDESLDEFSLNDADEVYQEGRDTDYCRFCKDSPCSCQDEDPVAGDIDDGSHYVPEPGPLDTPHYFALKERGYI